MGDQPRIDPARVRAGGTKNLRLPLMVLLLSVFLCLPARAQVVYINNASGNDAFDGRSPRPLGGGRGPVKTLQRALEIAAPGETIRLALSDRPWVGGLSSGRPGLGGIEGNPVIIDGAGCTITGRMPLPPRVWSYMGNGVYRMQPFRKGYYQLFLNGEPATYVDYKPSTDNAELPQLNPLEWTHDEGHIYFRVKENSYIEDYALEYPGDDVGLDLYGVRHVVVRNLTLEGFYLDGITVHGDSSNVLIESVTSRFNARSGLAIGGIATVEVRGSTFTANRLCEIYSYNAGQAVLRDCQLQGSGDFLIVARGGRIRIFNCVLGQYRKAPIRRERGTVEVPSQASGAPTGN